MFRYEHTQAGRFRQFHQFGFEIISNDNDPVYDAQVMLACYRFLQDLKFKDLEVQINSTGCNKCRPNYKRKLVDYYKSKEKQICADDRRRLKENPMRLLDCKEEKCVEIKKDAPNILDSLCSDCRKHFKNVLEFLEEVKLPYILNNHRVRGFDYYPKTVFEIFHAGFSFAIASGGRYDYLLEMIGGRQAPGVGGAIGLERALEVIKQKEISLVGKIKPKIYLIHIGDLAKAKALAIVEMFREANMNIVEALGKESLRAQLKSADKIGSPLALIFGQQEAFEQSIIIRDMKTGAQETVPLKKVVDIIKGKLR
jgi:histidyl-tRNA synthetase